MRLVVDDLVRHAMARSAPGEEPVGAAAGRYKWDVSPDYFRKQPPRSLVGRVMRLLDSLWLLSDGQLPSDDPAATPTWIVLTASRKLFLLRAGLLIGRPRGIRRCIDLSSAKIVSSHNLKFERRAARAVVIEARPETASLGLVLFEMDAALADRIVTVTAAGPAE